DGHEGGGADVAARGLQHAGAGAAFGSGNFKREGQQRLRSCPQGGRCEFGTAQTRNSRLVTSPPSSGVKGQRRRSSICARCRSLGRPNRRQVSICSVIEGVKTVKSSTATGMRVEKETGVHSPPARTSIAAITSSGTGVVRIW